MGEKVHKASAIYPFDLCITPAAAGMTDVHLCTRSCKVKRKSDSFSMKPPGKKSLQSERGVKPAAEFWPVAGLTYGLVLCIHVCFGVGFLD